MSIEQTLVSRSGSKCELCSATEKLTVYQVPPEEAHADKCIYVCETCRSQLAGEAELNVKRTICIGIPEVINIGRICCCSWKYRVYTDIYSLIIAKVGTESKVGQTSDNRLNEKEIIITFIGFGYIIITI